MKPRIKRIKKDVNNRIYDVLRQLNKDSKQVNQRYKMIQFNAEYNTINNYINQAKLSNLQHQKSKKH